MRLKRKAREDDEDDQDIVQLALELGTIFGKSFDIKLKVRIWCFLSSCGCWLEPKRFIPCCAAGT